MGFFISKDGLFLTNYHVMREEIEAANRTAGSDVPVACHYTSFEVPIVRRGRIMGWKPLKNVKLLRNLSAKEWQEGYDAALLQAALKPSGHLPIARRAPLLGEEMWSFGFPVRTKRSQERLQALGYTDADGSLRRRGAWLYVERLP